MKSLLLACALCLIASAAGAQSHSDLAKRQKELQSIRDEIKKAETQIKDQQKKEKASLDLLDQYDRKSGLVRTLLRRLHEDEQSLALRIDTSRATIARLEAQFGYLQDQYARYVKSVYKAGPVHDLELLLSANSLNQLAIRNEYLKRFSRQRKRDADTIVVRKQSLEETEARLQVQLEDQRRVITEKNLEEERLATLATERRTMIAKIRKDKKLLQKTIDRQKQAAKDVEALIARLIEAERIKKEKEEKSGKGALPQPPPTASTFANRKGHLRWPVGSGAVVAHFGAQTHPTLKTVTQNTGIDISVKVGTAVSAVASGEVATIWWLPWYGNLVIINHYGGFRTVYTHLADIKVTEGQKVEEGDVIAETGETVDGPRLHFEIWKDQEKQNPELWLSKQ